MGEQRLYSEAEFALILHKAAELANPQDAREHSSGRLTLAEMMAAAAEVGIDPALVERAARLLPATSPSSVVERLIGGPLRHSREVHVPVAIDEARAARLLAAVQIGAGQAGTGQASSMGVVWHANDEVEVLGVTAQPDDGGTSVAIDLDRRGSLAVTAFWTMFGGIMATLAAMVLSAAVAPALGAAAGLAGMGGTLALARHYWASSTTKARARIDRLMDAVGRAMAG